MHADCSVAVQECFQTEVVDRALFKTILLYYYSCLLKFQTRIVVNWIIDKKFAPVSTPVCNRDRARDRKIRDRIRNRPTLHSVRSQANVFFANGPRWRLVNKINVFSSLVSTYFISAVLMIIQGPKNFFELIFSHSSMVSRFFFISV